MSRIIITLFLCFTLFGNSYAQNEQNPGEDSTGKIVDSVENQIKDISNLEPLGWVSDFEHIFSGSQILELDSIISHFEKETTNEIAIVTLEKSWTTKENFDSMVYAISKNWGIGKNDKNNGILIGICTELRSIRIQNGAGIVEKLTDKETKKIIDKIIIPEFKKGNYFDGVKSALLALMQKVR